MTAINDLIREYEERAERLRDAARPRGNSPYTDDVLWGCAERDAAVARGLRMGKQR